MRSMPFQDMEMEVEVGSLEALYRVLPSVGAEFLQSLLDGGVIDQCNDRIALFQPIVRSGYVNVTFAHHRRDQALAW